VSRLTDYLALLEEQAESVILQEDAVAESMTARIRALVDAFVREFLARWHAIVGPKDVEPNDDQAKRLRSMIAAFVSRLRELIGLIDPLPVASAALSNGVLDAAAAARIFEESVTVPRVSAKRFPRELRAKMDAIQPAAFKRAKEIVVFSGGELNQDRVIQISAMARAVTGSVESGVRIIVNRGNSAGIDMTAKANGWESVWRPERDACLDCLALAGLASRGGHFPIGRTFRANGKAYARPKPPLLGPPLHPNCRCGTAAWNPDWATGRPAATFPYGGDLQEALKREAKRSVVKGWALPSESDRARRDAAIKLLGSDPNLPPTVLSGARARTKRKAPFATRIP
jgi:hypothetical protein